MSAGCGRQGSGYGLLSPRIRKPLRALPPTIRWMMIKPAPGPARGDLVADHLALAVLARASQHDDVAGVKRGLHAVTGDDDVRDRAPHETGAPEHEEGDTERDDDRLGDDEHTESRKALHG